MLKKNTTKTNDNQDITTTFKLNFQHKSGENISIVTSVVPFYDDLYNFLGFRGMSRKMNGVSIEKTEISEKIQDLKAEKDKIPLKKENYNTLLTKNPLAKSIGKNEFDYYFLFDKNTNIVECSEDMIQKLGYDRSEILSLTLCDLDCFDKKDDVKNKVNKVMNQGKMVFKTMYRKKDRRTILVNETICYLKDKNLFECFVKEEVYKK
jgi:PAS domain-containing protein